jgi:chromosome segregation ATPase
MQIGVSQNALRTRALSILQDAKVGKKADRHHIDFLMLAIRGKKVGFDKVVKMIDDMVALMKEEASNDEAKKEYCEKEFDQTDDQQKALERTEGKLEKAVADTKESVASLKEEIAALGEGIVALDKSVAEATDQRREENSDYKTLMMNNQAAKELLEFAKNRLNKFYNPKLVMPTMFMQISAHKGKADQPGPPPAAPGAHKKQDGNGVIAMIDTLIKGLDTEMTEAKTNEKNAQEEYEEMMADSASKRSADTKSITDKNSAKANGAALIDSKSKELTSTKKEIVATVEFIGSLHAQCDWLLKYFDMRVEARNGEMDSLKKAKAVLSGASFSLVQKSARRFLDK